MMDKIKSLKQPSLLIKEVENKYTILSVGFNKGNPLVTILEK